MTKILRAVSLFALSIALIAQTGCDPNEIGLGPDNQQTNNQGEPNYSQVPAQGASYPGTSGGNANGNGQIESPQAPQLIIGSFNIEILGKTKMSKPGVVAVLVDVARRFDVLAIQELKDKPGEVLPAFLKLINADGSRYAAAVGPRQGYVVNGQMSNNAEQAIFIYDTTKVELIGRTYAAHDQYSIMHRSPFVGHFRSIEVPPEQAFSFVLLNVHIDPDDTKVEFEALQEIIGAVYANHRGEDDFILLGDMNAGPHVYQQYQWMRNQRAMLPSNVYTNTAGNKAYDNLVFDANYTSEFRNQSGVMNLMEVYQLSQSDAQLVSDHYPVWGVFSAVESRQTLVTQGTDTPIRR